MPTKKKLYRAYLTVTLPNGEKKQMVFSSTKSQKEADRKRDEAKWEYERGLLVFNGQTTVAQYAEKWQEQEKLSKDDCSRLRRYCVDLIGGMRVSDVKATNIRDCYAKLDGLAASTISKVCGVINRMFNTMLADELITRNPCQTVQRPAGHKNRRRSLTPKEEELFLQLLQSRVADGKHWYDIAFGLSYACGLRPGEVRGLTRSNVYLDGPEPHIKVVQAAKDTSREIGPPKTAAGMRTVPIPQSFVPLIRQAMAAAPVALWVLPAEDGGVLSHQTYVRRWRCFYRKLHLLAGAKTYRNQIVSSPLAFDLDPYCLRHTYCTNCAYLGIPEVVTMRWMGHDDPNMIRKIYGDASNQKLLSRAIDLLNASAQTNTMANTQEQNTSASL